MPLSTLLDWELALKIDSLPSLALKPKPLPLRKKVLYIEDRKDNAEVVRRAVQRDYTFIHATTGVAGLSLAERHSPDLILLDIGLPDLDGFEVARRLRKIPNLCQRHIPIIALTGDCSEETRGRVEQAGFDFYMTKPMDFPELWKRLDELNGSTESAS